MKFRNLKRTHKFKQWKSVWILVALGILVAIMGRSYGLIEEKSNQMEYFKAKFEEKDDRLNSLLEENVELKRKLEEKIKVDEKITQSPPAKSYAMQKAREVFGDEHLGAFEKLITKESGFNVFALNKSSGACGMFQALPCSKLPGFDLVSQVNWGLKYIKQRYGDPSKAWNFHLANNWY